MNFQVITFGCKLNQAESEQISADLIFSSLRLEKIINNKKPNLIILNACAVTHKAVRECRQKVNQLKRKYPKSKLIVTGCLTERDWENVDIWVDDKNKILEIIKKKIIIHEFPRLRSPFGARFARDRLRTRALIKIQTGCNNFCAYCIVPFMRGKPVSRNINQIIQEIKQKEKQGFKEIVLTGVNIGLYQKSKKTPCTIKVQGRQKHKNTLGLIELLKIILRETSIQRIRLGSLWPTHITKELIDLYSKNPRLCPHFHLSIQSGSNRILKLMGRNYTKKDIQRIIQACRKKIPKINFTCDIIVGFPGETEKDFQDSCNLIQQIGFSKVHVFKYSKRPKTKATKMLNQIPEKIKQQRSRQLIKLADKVAKQVKKKFISKKLPVLWEAKRNGYWYGFTNNYLRVKKKTRARKNWENEIEEIKLSQINIA